MTNDSPITRSPSEYKNTSASSQAQSRRRRRRNESEIEERSARLQSSASWPRSRQESFRSQRFVVRKGRARRRAACVAAQSAENLFKCRLRNASAIYQDLRAEIIVVEHLLLLVPPPLKETSRSRGDEASEESSFRLCLMARRPSIKRPALGRRTLCCSAWAWEESWKSMRCEARRGPGGSETEFIVVARDTLRISAPVCLFVPLEHA